MIMMVNYGPTSILNGAPRILAQHDLLSLTIDIANGSIDKTVPWRRSRRDSIRWDPA